MFWLSPLDSYCSWLSTFMFYFSTSEEPCRNWSFLWLKQFRQDIDSHTLHLMLMYTSSNKRFNVSTLTSKSLLNFITSILEHQDKTRKKCVPDCTVFSSSVFYCSHMFCSAMLFSPAEATSAKLLQQPWRIQFDQLCHNYIWCSKKIYPWKNMIIHSEFPDKYSRPHGQNGQDLAHTVVRKLNSFRLLPEENVKPWVNCCIGFEQLFPHTLLGSDLHISLTC